MPKFCALLLAGLVSLPALAAAQAPYPSPNGDPELLRRCQTVATLTERTICDNRDLRALERDIRRYLRLVMDRQPGRAAGIEAAQAEFDRRRETACGALGTSDGYDGPAYRCIRLHQRLRLTQLAAMATGKGANGLYRAARPDMAGELTIVEWPDGTAQVMIDTITPPDARTCSIHFAAPSGPAISGSPVGAPECRIGIDALGGNATVRSDGDCRSVCVLGGRPDGLYRR